MQRKFIPGLAILLGCGACGLAHVVRQACQFNLVVDKQAVSVSGVENVFRKPGGEGCVFFLDFGETGLLGRWQFCTTQPEIAQRVVDYLAPRRRQVGEIEVVLDGLVFIEQGQVLRQCSPELDQFRLVFVVSGTQFRCIRYRIQMADNAPCPAQFFGHVLQRDDKVVPGNAIGRRFQQGDNGMRLLEQRGNRRRDVGRRDFVEPGEAGKVEQGIASVDSGRCHCNYILSAASMVLTNNMVMVIGPTPPGTGVM